MDEQRRWLTYLRRTLWCVGSLFLAMNITGLFTDLRSEDIDGYVDFAGERTLPFDVARSQLSRLAASEADTVELVTRATRIFHEGMAHIDPEDVATEGFAHYRMRVPITENWVLFALSYIKPDTYRDYEFCDYRRALRRGTGRCGQQAMALVSYLSRQGVSTGFVALGGHAIATAEVSPGQWYLLDPDYGGVIPYGLSTAERRPADVLEHYWGTAARRNHLDRLFGREGNSMTLGGPEARYARACPIEVAAYWIKWAVPLLALGTALVLCLWSRIADR